MSGGSGAAHNAEITGTRKDRLHLTTALVQHPQTLVSQSAKLTLEALSHRTPEEAGTPSSSVGLHADLRPGPGLPLDDRAPQHSV